jgi:hypothetical protein
MPNQGERKPPGLPSVYKGRTDRERGRYARGSPALWLSAVAGLAGILVAYHVVSDRQLGSAKDALLRKQRAVRDTVGAQWFPLRDAMEKLTLDAASKNEPDFVDPEAARWDFRSSPGLYLRLRAADVKDVASLRHGIAASKRDGFVACFLREPNAPAARGDADAGAFSEQPWNWQRAYSATRILTDDWVHEVNDSGDSLRLRVFEQQYDKAMAEEIPAAVDIIRRAQFFLLILDEDSPDAHPEEAGAALSLADLESVPHFARVYLTDLRQKKEIVRVRRSAEAAFVFTGERAVQDQETLSAMKRQVNNCALAKEVDRAIHEAATKQADASPTR